MKIDNFALTMFQTCPAKYDLRMRQGWTSRRRTGALGFGAALHEGLAAWYRTGNPQMAMNAINDSWPDEMPADDFRTKEKCIRTMAEYIARYPKESWELVGAPHDPIVEQTFTLPTGLTVIGPNGEEPLEYGGIFDGLLNYTGSIYILEHKTTSMLGQYYFSQFKPNNQVTGYIWAAQQLSGQKVSGALVNAIGIYKSSATKFERTITTRSPHDIEDWLRNLQHVAQQIMDCETRGYFPLSTPSCTQYGLCEYHSVHSLSHPQERERLLEQDYIRQPWHYESRDLVKESSDA